MENKTEPSQKLSQRVSSIQPNPPSQIPNVKKSKSFLTNKLFLIALAIAILFTLIYAGIYLNYKLKWNADSQMVIHQPSPTPDPTANWKTYVNTAAYYEFKYPPDWPLVHIQCESCFDAITFATYYSSDPKYLQKSVESKIAGVKVENYQGSIDDYINATNRNDFDIKITSLNGEKAISYRYIKGSANYIIVYVVIKNGFHYLIGLENSTEVNKNKAKNIQLFNKMLSTFKFLKQSPSATCIPRPACLDAVPRCLMPESENMCPPKPTSSQVVCTQDAKLCPDGSYVSRQPPNCEFAKCP